LRISIFGCGYVGLVTGACFSEIGHEVVCADTDEARIGKLCRGEMPIYEPCLEDLVARNVSAGRLSFTHDSAEAVRFGDTIFICVGTPPLPNGDADLSALDNVARLIGVESRSSKLVVEKSTVPLQTGNMLMRALATYGRKSDHWFHIASNPEFLREGSAIRDFMHPERIVIGVSDEIAESRLRDIYRPIVDGNFICPVHEQACPSTPAPPVFVTSVNSAELIKHACNSFLALKISYANLIADICEGLRADVDEVVRAMALDPRIGPAFLGAGLGFGGNCLPKDLQAFIRVGENASVDMSLLKQVEGVNKERIDRFVDKTRRALWVLKNKRIGVLGLAFKPGTDDIRFAPSLELIRRFLAEQAHVQAFDPQAMDNAKPLLPAVRFCGTPQQVAEHADALIIATEWEQFKQLDWASIKDLMARPLILDGRNLLSPKDMAALGFEYHGVGREVERRSTAKPTSKRKCTDDPLLSG
jgi:UDPglucose 6-dehydrogenase